MEYLSLSAVTLGLKDIVIGSKRLVEQIVVENKQAITYIYIQGHGDLDFPFGSRKSGNKISVDFGRNVDEKIGMNPLRSIGSPCPQVTSTRLSN